MSFLKKKLNFYFQYFQITSTTMAIRHMMPSSSFSLSILLSLQFANVFAHTHTHTHTHAHKHSLSLHPTLLFPSVFKLCKLMSYFVDEIWADQIFVWRRRSMASCKMSFRFLSKLTNERKSSETECPKTFDFLIQRYFMICKHTLQTWSPHTY